MFSISLIKKKYTCANRFIQYIVSLCRYTLHRPQISQSKTSDFKTTNFK